MSEIKQMPTCNNSDDQRVLEMINTIEKAHRDLKRLDLEKEISNSTIVSIIDGRLPEDIQIGWIRIVTGDKRDEISRDKFPSLLKLLSTCKERIEYKLYVIRFVSANKDKVNHGELSKTRNGQVLENRKQRCWLHQTNGDHPIWRCMLFESKEPQEKVDLVRKNNACFAWLDTGNVTKICKRNFKCKEEGCGLPHHQLLHEAHASGIVFHGTLPSNRLGKQISNTILQLQRIQGGQKFAMQSPINVLWDGGSTFSFITFKLAKRLKLSGQKVKLEIVKVGGETNILDSRRYELCLTDKHGDTVTIEVFGINKLSTDIVELKLDSILKLFDGLEATVLNRPRHGRIDCLIGYQYAAFHPTKKCEVNHLLLLENRFGYVISGSHQILVDNTKKVVQHAKGHHATGRVEDFYAMENLGIECRSRCGSCKCGRCHLGGKNMSLKEDREYKLIEENSVYMPKKKKWQASYPWIKDPRQLPDNRCAACYTLKTMEKCLSLNPEDATLYRHQIDNMVARGVARKISIEEMSSYDGPFYYISHHAVLKPESKSTPCCIVFNSSANFHGHVLNEYYAKGPDMLNNLLGVLMRFRDERVAFVGDISKMFHSIEIPLIDQMTHRFLLRNLDTSKESDTYVMTAVNMGDRPSATIAFVALRKKAEMSMAEFPISILSNSYMDDIPDSAGSFKEAERVIKDIDNVLGNCGFKTKEWIMSGSLTRYLNR